MKSVKNSLIIILFFSLCFGINISFVMGEDDYICLNDDKVDLLSGNTSNFALFDKSINYSPVKGNRYFFKLTDNDKQSFTYKLFNKSNSICFIGDSITKGSANGGYPWYNGIDDFLNGKDIYNFSEGGFTSFDIIKYYTDSISDSSCDLYVIDIGTNDIRFSIISDKVYLDNINKIINSIDSDKVILLLSPFRTTDNDRRLNDRKNEKIMMYDRYDEGLRKIALNGDNIYYKDVNKYIKQVIIDYGEYAFLSDGIHPNNNLGIKLYSYALFR